tara:strand:- start:1 stop:228 length:228 start_codon:yes stop_codon:yes gene_type:complete
MKNDFAPTSKHAVLNTDQRRNKTNYVLQKMLMTHSPKDCANLLFDFFEKHTDLRRADITLSDFMSEYDAHKLDDK